MKTKEQQKTRAEEVAEKIKNMPIDPGYRENLNIPIPLGKGVLVKKISQSSLTTTSSGIIIVEGENTTPPHLGIIQSVGPLCSEYLKVGLRCYYNFYVDSSFFVDGENYAKMDENDVYYLVPPNALVMEATKTEKQVRVGKKLQNQSAANKRIFEHEQNEKDRITEIAKNSKTSKIIIN